MEGEAAIFGDVRLPSRFWLKVRVLENGCWQWIGAKSKGYGRFEHNQGGGISRRAHRFAYLALIGPIPAGFECDHACHTTDCVGGRDCPHRACVNVGHLQLTSNRENVLRGVGISAINAKKTQCLRGHPFSPENTHIDTLGNRRCRICHADACRQSKARKFSPFSLEDWTQEGERLLSMGLQLKGLTDEWRYRIGDWVATGEQHLGNEAYGHFSRFEDAFGVSQLRQLGWVAASVTRVTRELAPTWSHARAVASLNVEAQEAALTKAKKEGLSTRELSVLVRPTPAERERHACPTCGFSHWALVESEWKA